MATAPATLIYRSSVEPPGEATPSSTGNVAPPDPARDASRDSSTEAGRVARATRWARTEQDRIAGTVGDTRARLERARPRSQWIDAAFRTIEHDLSTGGAVIAGAVAFRVFLFLVPYVFVVVVGFGFAADAGDASPRELAREAGVGGLVAKAVSGAARLSGFERVTTLVVGVVALILGARALIKVLRVSYGMIWSVRPSKLKKTMMPALALIGLTTVALASAATIGALRSEGLVLAIVGFAGSTAVPFATWLFASWWLPRRTNRWQDLVPGALVVAIGMQLLHLVTVLWIAHVLETKTETYGAIGAALAILLWAYLLGRVITGAAAVDAALWLRREEDRGHLDREGT